MRERFEVLLTWSARQLKQAGGQLGVCSSSGDCSPGAEDVVVGASCVNWVAVEL